MKRRLAGSIVASMCCLVQLSPLLWSTHEQVVAAFTTSGQHSNALRNTRNQLNRANFRYGVDQESLEADRILSIRRSETVESVRDNLLAASAPTYKNESSWTNPNIASAALKRTVQLVSIREDEQDRIIARQILPGLLEVIGSAVTSDADGEPVRPNAAADAFVSLFVLARRTGSTDKLMPLAKCIWEQLQTRRKRVVSSQSPRLLLECVRAASVFNLTDREDCYPLYEAISNRLVQGDALSRLSSAHLAAALVTLLKPLKSSAQTDLVTAFARRLRKQTSRQKLELEMLVRVLEAANRFTQQYDTESKFASELKIAVYTLAKEALNDPEASRPLVSSEALTLLNAVEGLALKSSDPMVDRLHARLAHDSDSIVQTASLKDLAQFSNVLIHSNRTNSARFVENIGQKFVQSAHLGVEPWVVSNVLRYSVLTEHRDETVVESYKTAARSLFLDPAFLKKANALHVSNYLWFMYTVRWDDKQVLTALCRRILEPDFYSACTPKLACRLLSTVTSIFALGNWTEPRDIEERQQLLSRLFQSLGEHLLGTQMTPLDISSAIYAYAKSSYVQDMGIFDHLVDLMVSSLEEANLRQIAQSLWACGKMVGYEIVDKDNRPPYFSGALELARHLSLHSADLTTKDVSQSIWAIGRLQIHDSVVFIPLIQRAQQLEKDLDPFQISSIMWGMSMVKSKEFKAVFDLTRRFAQSDCVIASSREAANILYALGRLDIRDEDIFHNLSRVIMEQVDSTSAQAIATVLWAHQAVHITPPRGLLDRWANEKLGLASIQPGIENENDL